MSQINLSIEPVRTFAPGVTSAAPGGAARSSALASWMRWAAWILCGLIAFAFLWQPVGVTAQLGLAISVIVAMMLVRSFARGPFMRWTFLALGSFIVLRYVYLRATQTLPDIDDVRARMHSRAPPRRARSRT